MNREILRYRPWWVMAKQASFEPHNEALRGAMADYLAERHPHDPVLEHVLRNGVPQHNFTGRGAHLGHVPREGVDPLALGHHGGGSIHEREGAFLPGIGPHVLEGVHAFGVEGVGSSYPPPAAEDTYEFGPHRYEVFGSRTPAGDTGPRVVRYTFRQPNGRHLRLIATLSDQMHAALREAHARGPEGPDARFARPDHPRVVARGLWFPRHLRSEAFWSQLAHFVPPTADQGHGHAGVMADWLREQHDPDWRWHLFDKHVIRPHGWPAEDPNPPLLRHGEAVGEVDGPHNRGVHTPLPTFFHYHPHAGLHASPGATTSADYVTHPVFGPHVSARTYIRLPRKWASGGTQVAYVRSVHTPGQFRQMLDEMPPGRGTDMLIQRFNEVGGNKNG